MAHESAQRHDPVERTIALRVTAERNVREWSFETLAGRMEAFGAHVSATSLHRLETQSPTPRISVDQALVFCKVFGLTFEELTTSNVSPGSVRLAHELGLYFTSAEAVTNARRDFLLAQEKLMQVTRWCGGEAAKAVVKGTSKEATKAKATAAVEAMLEDAVQTWARAHWVEPGIASDFVEFLAGRMEHSPYASAINGAATVLPGSMNLLGEETGR